MSTAAVSPQPRWPQLGWRWPISVLLVLALHGAGLLLLRTVQPDPVSPTPPADAILLDLTPDAPAAAETAPPPPAAPVAPVAPVAEPPPALQPAPSLPSAPAAPDAIAAPPPRPPTPPRPKPAVAKPVVHAPAARPAPTLAAKPADNPPAPQAAPAATPPAASAGAEAATWASRLAAHLLRFRRYPPDAERRGITGVAVMRFSVDAGGRVVSSSLARSSGHDMLDQEAQDWLQRAQPLPPPPPDKVAPAAVTVPLSFVLH